MTKKQPQAAEKKSKEQSPQARDAAQNQLARQALISFRQTMYASKLVGAPEELIPFAWRYPLKSKNNKKESKYLRSILAEEKA